jgi:hypothetical protein
MKKQTFLIVVCEENDLKTVQKTLAEEGLNVSSGRKVGDVHIFRLTGNEGQITRVGCSLISLKNSFPIELALLDRDGFVD